LDELGQKLLTAIREPWRYLTDADERLYWPYLLGSLALAAVAFLLQRRRGERSAWRYLFPRRVWLHPSALADYRMVVVNAFIKVILLGVFLLSTVEIAQWIYQALAQAWGRQPALQWERGTVRVAYTLSLFVAWDLSRYVVHRLLHAVPFLWAFHKVHHSAEVLTPVTLYRAHPIESLLFSLRGVLVAAGLMGLFFYFFGGAATQYDLVGINALGFVFNLMGANLRHSHIWIGYGPWLERLFISPAQHQLHHARGPDGFNRNFGTWLAIWDWALGSLRLSGRRRSLQFGLAPEHLNHDPRRVWSALTVHPFRGPVDPLRFQEGSAASAEPAEE
jgi:sterol desaturase/sphingolipid hydroxylase (fatty acid hydroxylase superfamily)